LFKIRTWAYLGSLSNPQSFLFEHYDLLFVSIVFFLAETLIMADVLCSVCLSLQSAFALWQACYSSVYLHFFFSSGVLSLCVINARTYHCQHTYLLTYLPKSVNYVHQLFILLCYQRTYVHTYHCQCTYVPKSLIFAIVFFMHKTLYKSPAGVELARVHPNKSLYLFIAPGYILLECLVPKELIKMKLIQRIKMTIWK